MKIRVVHCNPGEPAMVVEIEPSLGEMQDLVGGYIERVPLDWEGYILICNEEALLTGMPYNRKIEARAPRLMEEFGEKPGDRPAWMPQAGEMGVHQIHGPFFLVAEAPDGEYRSLDENEASWWTRWLNDRSAVPLSGAPSLVLR